MVTHDDSVGEGRGCTSPKENVYMSTHCCTWNVYKQQIKCIVLLLAVIITSSVFNQTAIITLWSHDSKLE